MRQDGVANLVNQPIQPRFVLPKAEFATPPNGTETGLNGLVKGKKMNEEKFIKIPSSFIEKMRSISGGCVKVFIAIKAHGKNEAWPSLKRISELSNQSERQIRRDINSLIKIGLLGKVQRPGKSSIYSINTPDTHVRTNKSYPGHPCPMTSMSPRTPMSGTPDTHVRTPPITLLCTELDSRTRLLKRDKNHQSKNEPDVGVDDFDGFKPLKKKIPEGGVGELPPKVPAPPPHRPSKPKENTSDIEAIYQAYPRHSGKVSALKSIEKVIRSGRSASEMLDRVKKYASSVSGDDPKYIPYPAKWFNQGHYDDEDLTPVKPKKDFFREDY
jgi:hypothetical protein